MTAPLSHPKRALFHGTTARFISREAHCVINPIRAGLDIVKYDLKLDPVFEANLLAYYREHPGASHGDVSRAFQIRPASASRFRKRFVKLGLLVGLNEAKHDQTQHTS